MDQPTFRQELRKISKTILEKYTFKNNIDSLFYTIAQQMILELYIQLENYSFDQDPLVHKWIPYIQRPSNQIKIKREELIQQRKVNQHYLKKVEQMINLRMDPNQYYIIGNRVYSINTSEPQLINQEEKNLEEIKIILKYISLIIYQYNEFQDIPQIRSSQFTVFEDLFLLETIYALKITKFIRLQQQAKQKRIQKLKKLSLSKLNLFYRYLSANRYINLNKINFLSFFDRQDSLTNFYQDQKVEIKIKKISTAQFVSLVPNQKLESISLDQISQKMIINLLGGKPSNKIIFAFEISEN